MRGWEKRGLALTLALAFALCLLPRRGTEAANLEEEKFEALSGLTTTDVGKCVPVRVGYKLIMNAGVSSDSLPRRTFSAEDDDSWANVVKYDGTVSTNSRANDELKAETDLSSYNMMDNFGSCSANGSESTGAQPGFSATASGDARGHLYVNRGSTDDDSRGRALSISLGRKNSNDDYGSVTAKVVIKDNPTLNEIAKSGNLQFYFSGLVCGAKEDKAVVKDDHTVTKATIAVGSYSQTVTTDHKEHHTKGLDTGKWMSLSSGDTITISCSFWEEHGSAETPIGIAEAVLLFRDVSAPEISSMNMNVNGDYQEKGSGTTYREEILLNKESSISLDVNFSEPVQTSLPKGRDNDLLLGQLAQHRMFVNTPNTGFKNMGEPVYLSLNATSNGAVSMTDEQKQKTALRTSFKSLSYRWQGKESDGSTSGAYFGNNPVPNGGDWILYNGAYDGQTSITEGKNNAYAFLNKLIMASLHDAAGNPLAISSNLSETYSVSKNGNATSARDGKITSQNQLAKLKTNLKVQRTGGSLQKSVSCINPFQQYQFIIDAIPPTYSVTSNEVQPEVLTNLALNKGDEFDLLVNFSEGVQARQFGDKGEKLNFLESGTELQFKAAPGQSDALTATYKEGGGKQQWRFTLSIPDGAKYDVTALDIEKVVQSGSSMEYVITDYVGNPLQRYADTHPGKSGAGAAPPMDWARLKVDNTPPSIQISLSAGDYKITATDPTVNGSASGVFAPPTATGDQSLVYYVWVKSGEEDEAIAALTADNYAAVKQYTLVLGDAAGYKLRSINNGDAVKLPAEEAEWVLLAFAADKTWDTARQLIQYDEYKTFTATEEGATTYYQEFLKQSGVNLSSGDAVTYDLTTSQPDDWETAYERYYTKEGSDYQSLTRGASYPAWTDEYKNLYYQRGFSLLTADPTANDADVSWKDVYTDYYELVDGDYQPASRKNAWPDYVQGTYFTDYVLVTGETAPDNWASAQFYEKTWDDGKPVYNPINTSGVPDFTTENPVVYSITAEQVSIPTTDAQGNTIEKPLEAYKQSNPNAELYFQTTNAAETIYQEIYASREGKSAGTWPEYDSSKTYYALTVTPLTAQPSDWNAGYGNYFVLTEETFESVAGVTPAWTANTYYLKNTTESAVTYTLTTAEPSDWSDKYGSYFMLTGVKGVSAKDDDGNASVTAPEWETNAYWSKSGDEYALTDAEPSDWASNYGAYFTMTGVKGAAPAWDENTNYYLLGGAESAVTYTLTETQPDDWDTAYTQYLIWSAPAAYTPVQKAETVSYAADTYYRKTSAEGGYEALGAQEPSDWKAHYQDYYQKNAAGAYEHVPEVKFEFETNRYYYEAYVRVASEPADWRTVCRDGTYYLYTGNAGNRADSMTEGDFRCIASLPKNQIGLFRTGEAEIRLYSAPVWESGTYYSATLSIGELLKQFDDSERRDTFEKLMKDAPNNLRRIEIIASFSEFAAQLQAADREILRQSAQYEKWAYGKFKDDDSNWVYTIGNTVDKTPPVVEATVSGSGSNLVTLAVTVSDGASIVGGVKSGSLKYAFAQKGQTPDDTMWENVSGPSGDESAYQFTLSSDVYQQNHPLPNGEYDVYVKAEDNAGNATNALAASVKLDSGAVISHKMFLLEGQTETEIQPEDSLTDTPRSEANLAVSFAGKIDGTNLFERNFKLFYALEQTPEPTDGAAWSEVTEKSELTGDAQLDGMTTYRYALNGITAASGTWYLHLRYDYTRSGATESGYLSKAFWFSSDKPDVTWNVTQAGSDSISVQVTADFHNNGEGESYYQWVSGVQTTQPADGGAWQSLTLPATLTLDAGNPIAASGKATLWVRVTDGLGNETVDKQSYQIGVAQVEDVPPPEPQTTLLDVQNANGVSYAVVKLTIKDGGQETPPAAGSEYSYALTRGGTREDWSRWIPYESMIRVEIGSAGATADAAQFKFRSASGAVTEEADYLSVTIPSALTDSKPWAAVTRSTFQKVSAGKGLSLRFTTPANTRVLKDGAPVRTDTVHDSGVFSYTVENTATQTQDTLYVSVNNVLTTMPIVWGLKFSETAKTSSSVLASLELQDGVSVTGIKFTPKGGGTSVQSRGASQYMFRENGTAVFSLRNVIGETAEASATVGWIDNTPPTVTVTPDYSKFKRFKNANGEIVASGAVLVLTSDKPVRLTSHGGEILDKSDSEYRTNYSFAIWENNVYSFSVADALGNTASKSIDMYNLITEIPEPTVSMTLSSARDSAEVTIRGSVSELAKALGSAYRLYSGVTGGAEIALSDGSYVITRSYTENRTVKQYFTDNLGNQVYCTISVSGLDTRPPTLKVTGSPVLNYGDDPTTIPWRDYATVSDDFTPSDRIYLDVALDDGNALTADKLGIGANRVILTAMDRCGNYTEASAWVYALPADVMTVIDENGVLFMATAKDIALVDDDEIELTVSNYQLMEYGGQTVTNTAGTYDIYIQKGFLREGQLKYLQTVKLLNQGDGASHKIRITPDMLEGAGWYTIIIRNSEREREYVSFAISSTLTS